MTLSCGHKTKLLQTALAQGSMLLVTPMTFRAFAIFPSGHEVRLLRQRHLIKVKARLADNSFHDTVSSPEVSEISPVTTQRPSFISFHVCICRASYQNITQLSQVTPSSDD
jgi:hypothetical protein